MWNYGAPYGQVGHWGYMGGWHVGLHFIFWALVLALVVAALIALVRYLRQGEGARAASAAPARALIEERYARGEIDREEYLQKKKDLAS